MQDNLSLYHIFYTVARTGSISHSSRDLYISQPAISKAIQKLEQNAAAQQQMVAALQQEIAQLHQKNADLQARSTAYETSLESVFSSKSWKLTAPIRSLMRLFHRGN